MNDEINKILDRLERIDHKEYSGGFEFADSSSFDETARCFEERKKMAYYITNLQKENQILKEHLEAYKKDGDETQDRIDKAIDYIEKEYQDNIIITDYADNPITPQELYGELLDILKGDNK